TRLPVEQIEAEIARSQTIVEDRLGSAAAGFAYPFGRYDARSRAVAERCFECACSDRLGLATDQSDLFALERVDAYYLRGERLFELMLSGIFPWYVKARSIPRAVRRAVERSRG
ncbi:MAG TPA: polysaccharide deacetylase family protein, partial [Candidatus Binatia bacterium]